MADFAQIDKSQWLSGGSDLWDQVPFLLEDYFDNTTSLGTVLKRWNGSSWETVSLKRWNGSSFTVANLKVKKISGWV